MTEEVYYNHLCQHLKDHFGYCVLSAADIVSGNIPL